MFSFSEIKQNLVFVQLTLYCLSKSKYGDFTKNENNPYIHETSFLIKLNSENSLITELAYDDSVDSPLFPCAKADNSLNGSE